MSLVRLPLTARLTVLFTGVAALVLLGLGALVAWSTARHFVELDQMYLHDKVHFVDKLVAEAAGTDQLAAALDDMLDSHPGLFVQVWRGGQLVYGRADLTPHWTTDAPAPGVVAEWTYAGQTLRGLVEALQPVPAAGSAVAW
jgi:two-component system, OmpR family, heavy metal sensor histidine kinase CusS